jgi:tetrahydromethanopterin S-methyltransferase subunit D
MLFVLSNIEGSGKEAEMRSTLVALTLSTLSVFSAPSLATAQSSKVARGTVASIAGQSLTVKVGDQDMKFNVDSKTMVLARGASTKSARAVAAGKSGPHLNELLQNGQPVAVTYKDTAGALHATEIKAIAKVSAGSSADASKTSTGVVKSMGADWITINGRSGPASFDQTFKIDPATKVFAKGAGTATAAKGGKAPFTEIIKAGDHVTVSYHVKGDALHASDVHVTLKASH